MDGQLLIFIIFVLIIGGVALGNYYFSRKAIVRRKLKNATGKKITEFVSGEIAKVVGKVEYVSEPLISPLSGRPCAYYYVLVEQQVSSGKGSHWKTLIEEEVAGNFVIRDGKYCAHINTKNVKSYLVEDREYSSGFLEDASLVLEKYLRKHGQESEGFLGFNKTIRYKEGILEKGELMAVVGRGEWKNSKEEQLADWYGRVLSISSSDDEIVYLSDDPDVVRTTYA